jgi:hypothetical protein
MLPDTQFLFLMKLRVAENGCDRASSDSGQKLCVGHGSGLAGILPRGPGPDRNISGKAINFT